MPQHLRRRRISGEGTIFQRRDGRWVGRLSFGQNESGKRIQKTVYGLTQHEALEKLQGLRAMRQQAGKSIFNKESLGAFLDNWLKNHVEIHRAGKTMLEYSGIVQRHIRSQLGRVMLIRIDRERIVEWQANLAREGRSANVRRRALRVLKIALNHAVLLQTLAVNPCSGLSAPKHRRKRVNSLEPIQCMRLFEVCRAHRIGELITIAALTGLRKGELFALQWHDIDLEQRIVTVRQTLEELPSGVRVKEPKSESGFRTVALTTEAVRAFVDRRQKASDEGLGPARCSIVFPNRSGGYLRSSNFNRSVWYPLRSQAQLPQQFVFHDLRHTAASLLLAAGVDLKVIQHQLGHSDYSITANTYSHLLPNAQADAADRLSQFLQQRRGQKVG